MKALEFDVVLTRVDLKMFIFSRFKKQLFKLSIVPMSYFILAIFFAAVSFLVNLSLFLFLFVLIMFFTGCLPIYRALVSCKKVFNQGLDLVGKERKFLINKSYIQIFCDAGPDFCGRHFFYDLQSFKQSNNYFFLMFSKNIYIIIPVRCLSSSQQKDLILILNKAKS